MVAEADVPSVRIVPAGIVVVLTRFLLLSVATSCEAVRYGTLKADAVAVKAVEPPTTPQTFVPAPPNPVVDEPRCGMNEGDV